MNVELISHTLNPLQTISIAASMCYASTPNERIVKACIASGHESVVEPASFIFKVTGVSRALLAQITRHRVGVSFSVQSQRYCSMEDAEFIFPDNLTLDQRECMFDCFEDISTKYNELKTLGTKNEDARAVLPNACPTDMVVTFNLRSFAHFCHERLCTSAQKEIRDLTKLMKDIVVDKFAEESEDFANYLKTSYLTPKCLARAIPYCTERKEKCCKRAPHVSELKEKLNKKEG